MELFGNQKCQATFSQKWLPNVSSYVFTEMELFGNQKCQVTFDFKYISIFISYNPDQTFLLACVGIRDSTWRTLNYSLVAHVQYNMPENEQDINP